MNFNPYLLPPLNATLNATATFFLLLGFFYIKKGNISGHRRCMMGAFLVSCLFLVSYLTYHFTVPGVTKFSHYGFVRKVYFFILISHTLLSIINLPLVLITIILAVKGKYERHKKFAKVCLPIWLYVSFTGVLVYMMLYQWYPTAR